MDKAPSPVYTSKIIKAGALIDDTKTMLANWDSSQSLKSNLTRLRNQNIFGKATRSRVDDILTIFRQRYLEDPAMLRSLIVLMSKPSLSETVNRVLFYLSAQNDRLLHDAVTDLVIQKREQGFEEINLKGVIEWIRQLVVSHLTTTAWSEQTILRCSQELLSTMRDFGILEGANTKRIAPFYLPLEAFALIALYEYPKLSSGELLIYYPEWKLFFLSENIVERFLMEAHQQHLLEYYAAGSVVRLTFPTTNLEDYAHVIAQRSY
ncbi:MAG: DUF1819 family protein [Anaerolineaceae bacterium]|nr:DUF1819 family protein [Anaerolineaceae bacterium]